MSTSNALGRIKAALVAVAMGGVALATSGSCNPQAGTLSFYRNDDDRQSSFWDVFIEDEYYEDEYYYHDDHYYDDYYYDDYYDSCGWHDCYYEEVVFGD